MQNDWGFMNIQIREMRPKDADTKGYVHHRTWVETYTGLMEDAFIRKQTLERCQEIAHRWPENTLVAELDGKIVGFCCYNKSEGNRGEITAIYLLKEAQGLGLGRMLMDAGIVRLDGCDPVFLWVLKGNDHAIGFYEHYGFRLDGFSKEHPLGTELRMTYFKTDRCASS